jgi:hypothetical protein
MLSVIILNVIILNVIILNVIILNVIMLNVIVLNVVLLSVMAPTAPMHFRIFGQNLFLFLQKYGILTMLVSLKFGQIPCPCFRWNIFRLILPVPCPPQLLQTL